jgi:hypothetical protein
VQQCNEPLYLLEDVLAEQQDIGGSREDNDVLSSKISSGMVVGDESCSLPQWKTQSSKLT